MSKYASCLQPVGCGQMGTVAPGLVALKIRDIYLQKVYMLRIAKIRNMPNIYLDAKAYSALEEVRDLFRRKNNISINYSQAVMVLHGSWKETK